MDGKPDNPLKSQFIDLDDEPMNTTCMLCDSIFVLPTSEKNFLTHLFDKHYLVIADVDKIASLKSYIRYWRVRFKTAPLLTEFCTTVKVKQDNDKFYYLLSDLLPEDKILREELKDAKLEWILSQQVSERSDVNFRRGCLFCRSEFSGSCINYVKHLSQKHNFLLGNPNNLVYVNELLDKIQVHMENFVCIYCEKKFKDRDVLKEHMRKKLHKRINPTNRDYDKYYIQNYSVRDKKDKQADKTQKRDCDANLEEPTDFTDGQNDEDWSGWNTKENVICLFCTYKTQNFPEIFQHMKSEHKFDFEDITKNYKFYERVKIVNFLRKHYIEKTCAFCKEKFGSNLAFVSHIDGENHTKLPQNKEWDRDEYYFPMQESDSFLYHLDVDSDDDTNVPASGH